MTSCTPVIRRDCRKGYSLEVAKEQLPLLMDASNGQLKKYHMTVDLMKKHHFSGLLFVKESRLDTYRVVFSTHFGLTIFDLEMDKDSLRVYHCLEALRRKKLLDIFHKDFSILMGINLQRKNSAILYSCDPQKEKVYKLSNKKETVVYYRIDPVSHKVRKIQKGKGLFKTVYSGSFSDPTAADSIHIEHRFPSFMIGITPIQ